MSELVSPLRNSPSSPVANPINTNPGMLYNVGNLLALLGAVALVMLQGGVDAPLTGNRFVEHFLGNGPALLTTTATLVFWMSGIHYAKAWAHGFPPHASANALGHALSTFGALLVGLALMGLARTEVSLALAIIATILHTGGKLASWQAPQADDYFKPMPLYSRIPYVTTLCLDMRDIILSRHPIHEMTAGLALPLCLLAATLFWARADWLLLQKAK